MKSRKDLKKYFETGDRPTELQFSHLINSGINQLDDPIRVLGDEVHIGISTDNAGLRVNTSMVINGDITGYKADQGDDEDVLRINNGSKIQMFGGNYPNRKGSMYLIGDKSLGDGEITFSQKLGSDVWRENAKITTEGFFGIGTSAPLDQFQVEEGMNKVVIGNTTGSLNSDSLGYIGFNVARVNDDNGGGNKWSLSGDTGAHGGALISSELSGSLNFYAVSNSTPDVSVTEMKDNLLMKLEASGNVGINQVSPMNLLHITKSSGSDTGLRLENKAGSGKVLISDANGNAIWRPKTFVTDEIWEVHTPPLVETGGIYQAANFAFINTIIGGPGSSNDAPSVIHHISSGNNGNVGIGTANPLYPLHVTKQFKDTTNGHAFFRYAPNPQSGDTNNGASVRISIGATHNILAKEFNAYSDVRIKEVQGVSNGMLDLVTLDKIEVTDYTLITEDSQEKRNYKKVIGQQLSRIYPQAVSLGTEAVPDVFKTAEVLDSWILLGVNNFVSGDKVKLIFDEKESIVEVLESNERGFRIGNLSHESRELFVYGKVVDDFHIVDYEAISMLNVSATQQLHKELMELRGRVEELEKQLQKQTV